jgi:hypothetical protein
MVLADMVNGVAAPGGLARGATALPDGDGGAMVTKLNNMCVGARGGSKGVMSQMLCAGTDLLSICEAETSRS